MATFHPHPPRVLDRKGEADVLHALSRLSFEAHVFINLGLLDAETNRDREIDFLVLHPELGIVLVEVKGGKLVNRGGVWHRDNKGTLQPLKEPPGEQLNQQQYLLLKYLQAKGGFVPALTRVLALPHMDWPADQDMGTDLPSCRILDRTRLEDPLINLRRAVAGHDDWNAFRQEERAKRHRISEATLEGLIRALEPALLPPPSLAELIREEGEHQDREAQALLTHLSGNFALGRFHVLGAPGSGKSFIARQTARIWTAEGRKVLYLAFNKALTHASQVALEDLSDRGCVDVSTYHDLLYNLLYDLDRLPEMKDTSRFFNTDLPEGFQAALPDIQTRWDAIVVDEAQDLAPEWITPLLQLLRHPDQDPVLLVEDPAQSLFREGRHTLGQTWRIELNLRQHPALRRAAWEAFPGCGWTKPPAAEDDPGVLQCRKSSPESWKQDLAAVLTELHGEGLRSDQVMILAPHRPESLGLEDGEQLGPWPLNTLKDWWEGERSGHVRFGTIQAFKGLEADVVVYLAPAYRHDKAERLRYTALTRARRRAYVLERTLAKPVKETPPPPPSAPGPPAPAPVITVRQMSPDRQAELLGALKAAAKGPVRRGSVARPSLPDQSPTEGPAKD